MKYKWNWGTKLAIWIIAFILFMITLVVFTFINDTMLVEKDYYPKGLEYQNRIEETNRAFKAGAVFDATQGNENLTIQLTHIQSDSGNIVFFRPSDNGLDLSFDLSDIEDSTLIIPLNRLKKGKYILKNQWYHQGNGYYLEKIIFVK